MQLTISLRKTDIHAMALFAGVEDIRYYLNTIAIEVGPKESRLVATNGHMMGMLRLPDAGCAKLAEPMTFIMPREDVTKFKKAKKEVEDLVVLTIDVPAQEKDKPKPQARATLKELVGGMSVEFGMIEAVFPDYRRVTPTEVSGVPCQFNAEYLAAFHKAAVLFGWKNRGASFVIAHNGGADAIGDRENDPDNYIPERGDGCCVVLIPHRPEFVGVIMPVRMDGYRVDLSGMAWAQDRMLGAKPKAEPQAAEQKQTEDATA